MRNSSLVKCVCAENVTGLKHGTEAKDWEVRGERSEVGIKSYEDLEVYQEAYRLVLEVYQLTKGFPKEEKYELISQLKRAALSVVLNIAEGYGRGSAAEFKHFLRNSLGSSNEVLVLLKLAKDMGFGETERLIHDYELLGKRIYRLKEIWEKKRD